MNHFTIYACDNQPVLLEGLERILEPCADFLIVGKASDLSVAITEITELPVDIFLVGQPYSSKSMLAMLTQAKQAETSAAVVLWVGDLSEVESFRALQMGARGIVGKTQPPDGLIECLRVVAAGSVYLESSSRAPMGIAPRRSGVLRITKREREIIELVSQGMKNKEIASSLSITAGTVKVHMMHIFEKTGVKDRFQLALQGRQLLSGTESEEFRAPAEA